jgi:hypothetical protein
MQRNLGRSDEVRMAERSKAPGSRKYILKKNDQSIHAKPCLKKIVQRMTRFRYENFRTEN